MNPNNLKVPKPTIMVYVSDRLTNQKALDMILYGAEEEGIPYEIEKKSNEDAYQLAYDASRASVLTIGIGVSSELSVVQQSKLAKDNPVDKSGLNEGEDALRRIGCNAARMSKRVPLRF